MSKTKKPNKSGYAFRGLFAGIDKEFKITKIQLQQNKEVNNGI